MITGRPIELLRARLQAAAENGARPDLFCSFTCSFSDSGQAQHAACLAVNGIHCSLLADVVEKGSPCRVRQLIR
ncbi:MAG: hypothetical protein GX444_11395 [Myxococcales bacterium]|nr:hypothetical protein [Myxococcales bacterium]